MSYLPSELILQEGVGGYHINVARTLKEVFVSGWSGWRSGTFKHLKSQEWPTSVFLTLGSLSNNVLERRTSTGSGLFSFFDSGFAQIFSQIASITVKKLRNTNFISSRHVKRENTSLPVDVRRSKTLLLKLPNVNT